MTWGMCEGVSATRGDGGSWKHCLPLSHLWILWYPQSRALNWEGLSPSLCSSGVPGTTSHTDLLVPIWLAVVLHGSHRCHLPAPCPKTP